MRWLAGGMLLAAVAFAGPAAAQADTPGERAQAVERYFQEVSMQEMMNDMVKEVSRKMPPEQRSMFEEAMLRHLRIEIVEEAAKRSLAKYLTVAEINALTEFLRRPEGKSVMGKMKYYMADLMPVVQQEIFRAINLTLQPK